MVVMVARALRTLIYTGFPWATMPLWMVARMVVMVAHQLSMCSTIHLRRLPVM
jgi:hypothetical protein